MSGVPTPPIVYQPFGKNAAGAYIQTPIPITSADPGRASMNLGFPPQTMLEAVAGGTPPYGQDANGILYMISAHTAAAQCGQPYLYNATVAAAIGGYKLGIVLGMADGTGLWYNRVDGNTTDPDASGAGWVALWRYGYQTLPVTGGTYTPTLLEARAPVLVLTGVLTSNLQLVLPPTLQEWLIVNATTGSFTTTAKTVAGTGVTIPQGGYASPVRVYGDGTNIYPGGGNVITPSSVAPVADTIALRDNLGRVYTTYLIQTSALENPTVGAIMVEASPPDTVIRKIAPADLLAQLFGTRLLTANGFYGLPFGFRIQWGNGNAAGNANTPVVFPVAFTSVFAVLAGGGLGLGDQDNGPAVLVPTVTATGFQVANGVGNNIPFMWVAIGIGA